MMLFGVIGRMALVALAVVVERVGAWFRDIPFLANLIASRPAHPIDADDEL